MAAKAYTKEELAALSVISLPKSYQRSRKIPLDPTEIFTSYEDAQAYANGTSRFGDIAYVGQVLSVISSGDSAVTVYKIEVDGSLSEIGSSSSPALTASTYTDARALATSENVGQIINVTTEESGATEVYSAGLYVVSGPGEVSKLGTTSASGDIEGDVETLRGRISTLENSFSAMSEYLYWETDEDLEIE
jgi:hypothetical protein